MTVDDILSSCLVDLDGSDYSVLDSLKNNPKVEIEDLEGILYFRYRAKYEIRFVLFFSHHFVRISHNFTLFLF